MSSIGWIDFSSEHREKVKTVIDLLAEKGVLDELGIGVIRNAFADRLFPGLTTIQTRAKYFTLTALLLKDYQEEECKKRNPRSLERYLEDKEMAIRIQLVERHGEGRQNLGIIGGSFGMRRDKAVVRRPSSIYWFGLRAFGMVTPKELSLAEFGVRLSDKKKHLKSILEAKGDDVGDDSDALAAEKRIQIFTPEIPDDYWEDLDINLLPIEARFLREAIIANQPDSLTAKILSDQEALKQVLDSTELTFAEFTELPFLQDIQDAELQKTLSHARDFWLILEGAHIRYNCLLQEAGFGTADLTDEFAGYWDDWRERIATFPLEWDSHFFWQLVGPRVGPRTRKFITSWIEETRNGASDLARCNELVTNQERRNKGSRARLRPNNSLSVNSWIGFSDLDYRLSVARRILKDIHEAEGGDHA